MIIVVAHLRLRSGTFDRFTQAVEKVIPPSEAEPGCVSYEAHRGLQRPEDVLFIERWTDRAALDGHFAAPHFKIFDYVLATLLDQPPHVEVFEIESSETL